ncbi:hypothetical protein COV93_03515 [Candidatus Woesearchaeota archaeon CG11_big_fil_rev_8_21_14_0_20_43_8]|nr:MAG: hypothetical protein COV93_03515 [Candidatus Woesearchaeota archaeon CG11_big_fil_rev_8_21_14_0_20_43_8]
MKVVTLGVGEAFDEMQPNNSHLVLSDKGNILLDCGYSVPHQLWKYDNDPDMIDAVFLSHIHSDHTGGINAILMRMWEDGRHKLLIIFSATSIIKDIEEQLLNRYPGFRKRFGYDIRYIGVEPGKSEKVGGLTLNFAQTVHSASNLAVSITDGKNKISYSGDGEFTDTSIALYKGSDLLIHEAYLIDTEANGHGSIKKVIEMAEKNEISCLALTHIKRKVRQEQMDAIKKIADESSIKVTVPEALEQTFG